MKKLLTILLTSALSSILPAQWSPASSNSNKATSDSDRFFTLDLKKLQKDLSGAEVQGRKAVSVEVKLPTLHRGIQRFAVYTAPVVVASLAERYGLQSYIGLGIDDPSITARFSVAPDNFQSMVFYRGQYEFAEPYNESKTLYRVHPKSLKTAADRAFVCSTSEPTLSKDEIDRLFTAAEVERNSFGFTAKSSDQKFRTLRLALSVTGEYTQYFGGVSSAMTQINATLTRVNGVFEKDFGLRLILQDFPELIYTDPATDPYSPASSGAGGTWNLELQRNLTNSIGSAAYDIGHLFGASGGGGNAGCIGCVCVDPANSESSAKGSAFTSPADGKPMGDNFDIDYVAHEIGHQLGANHTFAYRLEGTGQNVEPGSGSTVMSYAGITGPADVQPHSDAYFHINSIIQVQNNLINKTCDIETPVTNTPPQITPMTDVSIPVNTAFVLTAEVTDQQNDLLTYTWEQVDPANVSISKANLGKTTKGPSFRSVAPGTSPTRYFPNLQSVLAGKLTDPDNWEAVSAVGRTMNFNITVRDNHPDPAQQQTQTATRKINVVDGDAFKVTTEKVYNNYLSAVTWDIAGTNQAPFNVQNVRIDYTTDNGRSWIILKESTPNDGSEDIDFSQVIAGTTIFVRVSAIGNIFYAVAPVSISRVVSCNGEAPVGIRVASVTQTEATLVWEPVENATYSVRFKKENEIAWQTANVNSNTYTLTNLNNSSTYIFEVAAVCNGVTGMYAHFEFNTQFPDYCTLTGSDPSDDYIKSVVVTNSSGDVFQNTSGPSTYTDYTTNVSKLIELLKSTTNNKIVVQKGWERRPNVDAITVWIDFNRDGVFSDNEKIVSTILRKDQESSETLFTVPETALTNRTPTRMRIALRYNTVQNDPCGIFSFGEVEDYSVIISSTLGTDNQVKSSGISVYPNPAVDVLNVTKVSDRATYTIYNMAGQAVAKGNVADNKVQISKLQKGVYIISVDNNGETAKVKFIKK